MADNTTGSTGPQDYSGMWDMLRGLRDDFAAHRPRIGVTTGTGSTGSAATDHDVRAAALRILAEAPATGATVIRTVTDRATDGWAPTAAEVYPVLQLLVDEGLATVAEDAGRRTFTLTDAGRGEADDTDADATDSTDATDATGCGDITGLFAPFSRLAGSTPLGGALSDSLSDSFKGPRAALPKAGAKLGQAVHQVLLTGDAAQMEQATALLDETRRRIYGILAEETPASPEDAEDASGYDADAADTTGSTGTGPGDAAE